MIIFDLDGTLANCEHRRHFVDPSYRDDCVLWMSNSLKEKWIYRDGWDKYEDRKEFKPDWRAFYDACDKDEAIEPVIKVFSDLKHRFAEKSDIVIWSGRCESVREKTETWLYNNIQGLCQYDLDTMLKMRPVGDYTPDDQLKEKWLDEAIADGRKIDMIFDDRPKVVRMWRRRGIFVFDCNQDGKEF